jgi:hypothetical protein
MSAMIGIGVNLLLTSVGLYSLDKALETLGDSSIKIAGALAVGGATYIAIKKAK